jgi:hypothetical protein
MLVSWLVTGGRITRKTARGRAAGDAPTPTPVTGEVVKPVYVGRLETVSDWRRQIGKIYREMRKGELAAEDGTKLAFVANLGAQQAKVAQELQELQQLREQLARVQAGSPGYRDMSELLPALASPAARETSA